MPRTLNELLHALANQVQTARSAAFLLQQNPARPDLPEMQRLIDELEQAARLVQSLAKQYEDAKPKR